MLTYAWDGAPLLTEHGFPLRIYIPDLYGMKQPKWIESFDQALKMNPRLAATWANQFVAGRAFSALIGARKTCTSC